MQYLEPWPNGRKFRWPGWVFMKRMEQTSHKGAIRCSKQRLMFSNYIVLVLVDKMVWLISNLANVGNILRTESFNFNSIERKKKATKKQILYLSCIMRYRKISLRELRFGKSLVTFERLEQLIGEGFMCRLGKHAVSNQPKNMSG